MAEAIAGGIDVNRRKSFVNGIGQTIFFEGDEIAVATGVARIIIRRQSGIRATAKPGR